MWKKESYWRDKRHCEAENIVKISKGKISKLFLEQIYHSRKEKKKDDENLEKQEGIYDDWVWTQTRKDKETNEGS